jgi:orotate phosphoribosyltransferase-like protein
MIITEHSATNVLMEHATGMMTEGMSTRATASELNVHFTTLSHLSNVVLENLAV